MLIVLGDRKTIREMAQLYEKVYGVDSTVRTLGTREELHDKMRAAFEMQPGNSFAWMALFYQYFQQEPSTLLGELDNKRYPNVKVAGLEDFLLAHTKEDVGTSFNI